MATAKAKGARTRSDASDPVAILRTSDGDSFPVESGKELRRASYRWTYILRNRLRWRDNQSSYRSLSGECHDQLVELGLTKNAISAMAKSRIVEVSIPFRREDAGWEARITPWEFLISRATRKAGRRDSITVVRHLDRKGSLPKIRQRTPRLMVVTSAPGEIAEHFDFSNERLLPGSYLLPLDEDSPAAEPIFLDNPSIDELRAAVGNSRPEIVHVAGVDLHQGTKLLEMPVTDDRRDGLMFAEPLQGRPVAVPSEAVADALTAGRTKPALAVFNFYNSAARTAALTVARGAGAAIGFQDTFDDSVAESFHADFYESLASHGQDSDWEKWNPHLSFIAALDLLRHYDANLRGSGTVLWSARSMFDQAAETAAFVRSKEISRAIRQHDDIALSPQSAQEARKMIAVDIKPKQRLNYSLLHNRQTLFDRFEIRKEQRGHVDGVQVEVTLHVGTETPTYRCNLSLERAVTKLNDKVFIPLTWMKDGGFWENVRSSLQVRVEWQSFELHSESHAVTLAPADEWRDTDQNRQSLPSFVYPRDPAVGKVVAAAQEELTRLTLDRSSGFDGYQAIDPSADDPTRGVDLQVQAIWNALIRAFSISYINPPPSFADYSQRLRTPSEVISGGRGTCIDLTMLLAACLEYVEIYPVIFLLHNHAFPGYWRSPQAHDAFMLPLDVVSTEQSPNVWQESPWVLEGASAFDEVTQQVHDEHLVPIESVWLTQLSPYLDAVEEGWEDLRIKSEFQSLIDVTAARSYDVTPLPIRGLRAG